jgi:hypothetical protein
MAEAFVSPDAACDPTRERRMHRVRRLSRMMARGCLATSVLLVAAMIAYWVATPAHLLYGQAGLAGRTLAEAGWSIRILACGISMVPLAVMIYGLVNARSCFAAFAAGDIFSVEAIKHLRAFAIAVAISALLKPFAGAALSILLSWNEAAGRKTLVLNVGSDTLLALIFAGTVAVIAWVMTEAIAIAEENKQFV